MFRILYQLCSKNRLLINNKSSNQIRGACNQESNDVLVTSQTPKLPDGGGRVDSHIFCIEHVKKYDRENYLAALCIEDPVVKRAMFALRAFNVELSLVRDSTTNSDRAKLRFHFWSKLVEEIIRRNDERDQNIDKINAYYNYTPVAKELLQVFYLIEMDTEIKQDLNNLIGARVSSKVLGYKPFENLKELELYCSKSNSSLYNLSWIMAKQMRNVWHSNYKIEPTLKLISDELGVAHGLSNVIRGIPYNSTKNCCYIPREILNEYKLTNRDFIGKNLDPEKIAPVVELLSLRCQEIINKVYSETRFIPGYFKRLYLPCITIQSNLYKLKRCRYNICDPSLGRRDNLLPLNLWMATKFFRTPILGK